MTIPRRVAVAFALLACALPGCAAADDDDANAPVGVDREELQGDVDTTVNRDPGAVVVWEQNIAKGRERVGLLLRCMADRRCAGEHVPDVVLFNEADESVGRDLARRMTERLGVRYTSFGDASLAGTSVVWRAGRFTFLDGKKIVPSYKNRAGECQPIDPAVSARVPGSHGLINAGRNVAVRLRDERADKSVVAISVHFPHPYEGGIPNCESPETDYDGICTRANARDAVLAYDAADLEILGGDFNYKSKCDGADAGAYKMLTGRTSGRFAALPFGDAAGAPGDGIDYIFASAAGRQPARESFVGYARVPKTFYCAAGEPDEQCRFSDHDLRRVTIRY